MTAPDRERPWSPASEERLDVIEANECPYREHELVTLRFRRVFNELHVLRAAIAAMPETAPPICEFTGCGTSRACCRKDCPMVIAEGDGCWFLARRDHGPPAETTRKDSLQVGWQPLGEVVEGVAPWDGTEVLLWSADWNCRVTGYWSACGHVWITAKGPWRDLHPSHWRPLPSPPTP